jgi:hypothetical protein
MISIMRGCTERPHPRFQHIPLWYENDYLRNAADFVLIRYHLTLRPSPILCDTIASRRNDTEGQNEMTVQYYQGWQIGGSGYWFDPVSWSGETIPGPNETVVIATPGPDIGPTSYGGYRGGLNNITIDVQPAFSFSQPVLTGDDITYGAGFTLNFRNASGSETTAPTAVMEANGTTMFRGSMNLDASNGSFTIDVGGQQGSGTFINAGSGKINVEHGTQLTFADGPLSGLTNNGVIAISEHSTVDLGPTDGHGRITLQSGSTLQLNGAVAVDQKIQFLSGNDTLVLNAGGAAPTGSSLTASGNISGFRAGDVIQLLAPNDTPTSVTYLQAYHVLAVRDASGGLVAKLHIDGNYQSNAFALTAEGNGKFDISLAGSNTSSAGGGHDLSLLPAMAGLNPATDFPVVGGTSSGTNSGATATASPAEPAGSALPFGSVAYSDHNASIPLSMTNHGSAMS